MPSGHLSSELDVVIMSRQSSGLLGTALSAEGPDEFGSHAVGFFALAASHRST